MNIKAFLKDLEEHLNKNFDPVRAQKEKAYLYSEWVHYGVPSAVAGKFFSKHKKDLLNLDKKEALGLVETLWEKPSWDEKMCGLNLLNLHKDELDISDMPFIERIMRESGGWAPLDNLIIPIMPGLLAKDKRIWKYLSKWIKDNDFWVRRSALLAQLLFFRKSSTAGDRDLFFNFAKFQFDESWVDKVYKDALMRSRARFFIRKAIGWVLREMSVKDPKSVVKFVNENKRSMSRLSYKEAIRRLPNEYKVKLK